MGLSRFNIEDHELFFGRKTQISDLYKKVKSQIFTAVTGPSGCGKSSLVFAGVASRLKDDGYLCIEVRFVDEKDPFISFSEAIGVHIFSESTKNTAYFVECKKYTEELKSGGLDFADCIRGIRTSNENKSVLIVIDQFEEIFNEVIDNDLRKNFLSFISEVTKEDFINQYFSLVITLRYDFFHEFNGHPEFYDVIDNGFSKYDIGFIKSADDLREIIENPLQTKEYKRHGIRLEDRLTDTIIQDSKRYGYNLSLIEFTLTQLWDDQEDGLLKLAAYQGIGNTVKENANAQFGGLSSNERGQAETLFVKLVTLGDGVADTKKRISGGKLDDKEWRLAQKLAETRVVDLKDGGNVSTQRLISILPANTKHESYVEIVHDILIQEWEQLGEWLKDYRPFLRWRSDFEVFYKSWQQEPQTEEHYLSGLPLATAEEWMHDNKASMLTDDEREFISTSIAFQKKLKVEEEELIKKEVVQQRKMTIIALGVAFFTSILMFFLESSKREEQKAKEEAITASKRLMATLSEKLLNEGSARLAILVALEALESNMDPSGRDEPAYKKALETLKSSNGKYIKTQEITIPGLDQTSSYDITPDVSRIVYSYDRGKARVWDINENKSIVELNGIAEWFREIKFHENQNIISLTSNKHAPAEVWDLNARKKIIDYTGVGISRVYSSNDSKYFLAVDGWYNSTLTYVDPINHNETELFSVGEKESLGLSADGCCFYHGQKGRLTKYLLHNDIYKKDVSISTPDVNSFVFLHNQSHLLAFSQSDDVSHSNIEKYLETGKAENYINTMDFDPHGEQMFFDRSGGLFAFYDLNYAQPHTLDIRIYHSNSGGYVGLIRNANVDYLHSASLDASSVSMNVIADRLGSNSIFGRKTVVDIYSGAHYLTYDKGDDMKGLYSSPKFVYQTSKISAINKEKSSLILFDYVNIPRDYLRIYDTRLLDVVEFGPGFTVKSTSSPEVGNGLSSGQHIRIWDRNNGQLLSYVDETSFTFLEELYFGDSGSRCLSTQGISACDLLRSSDGNVEAKKEKSNAIDFHQIGLKNTDKNIKISINLPEKLMKLFFMGFSDVDDYFYLVVDRKILVWNTNTMSKVAEWNSEVKGWSEDVERYHSILDFSTTISDTDNEIRDDTKVIFSSGEQINIYSLLSGELLFSYVPKSGKISNVTISSNMGHIAWAEGGSKLMASDYSSGDTIFSYDASPDIIKAIDISEDAQHILWAQSDGEIVVAPLTEITDIEIIDEFRNLNLEPLTDAERERYNLH